MNRLVEAYTKEYDETKDGKVNKKAIAAGLVAAGLIGAAGYKLHKQNQILKKAVPKGEWMAWAQALDNMSDDPHMVSGVLGNQSMAGADAIRNKTWDTWRAGSVTKDIPKKPRVAINGHNIGVHVYTDKLDYAGRLAPISYHGNIKDGLEPTMGRIKQFLRSINRGMIHDGHEDEIRRALKKAGMK